MTSVCYSTHYTVPALLIGVLLFAVSLERRVHPLSQKLHLTGVRQTLGIFKQQHEIVSRNETHLTSFQLSRHSLVNFRANIFQLLLYISSVSVPGLKRMIARRQPSSVLSICMSLILLTSSVKTLRRKQKRFEYKVHMKTVGRCQII